MSTLTGYARKYWIVFILLIWFIAWSNREWLAGDSANMVEVTTDESPAVTVLQEETLDQTASETVAEPSSIPQDPPLASSVPESLQVPQTEAVETDASRASASDAVVVQISDDSANVSQAESLLSAQQAEDSVVSPLPPASTADSVNQAPEIPAIPDVESSVSTIENTVTDQMISATERLENQIRLLPAQSPQRADLLGELGNLHFSEGRMDAALRAYDQALLALPVNERLPMVRRLAPIYDRYHPSGREHLRQFLQGSR